MVHPLHGRSLRRTSLACVLAAAGLLTACGGNDDGPAPAGNTTPTAVQLSGVVAIGAPVAGAQVQLVCAGGTVAPVTTAADGSYAVPAEGLNFPCLAIATGGTIGGAANTDALLSAVLQAGTANVTTLTSLQASALAGRDLVSWLEDARSNPAGLRTEITAETLATALEAVRTRLASLSLSLPAGFDPVRSAFKADGKDAADALLDQLKSALAAGGATIADAQVQLVARQDLVERTPTSFTLEKIGGFAHSGGASSAEIVAFDPLSKRLFTVNGALGTVDVLDMRDPAVPRLVGTIQTFAFGSGLGGANSVAVHNGVVAIGIEASPKTSNGIVALVRAADLVQVGKATVGALPDMVTFTPDGKHLLVANEGEPSSYGQTDSVDPEGSVSVIALSELSPKVGKVTMTVTNVGFTAFNSKADELRAAGVRIFGPGATVAQDLEPEYIAVSPDSKRAYVTLQENNAIATIDIASKTVLSIKPLGLKDHSLAGNALDVSDEDGGTNTNSGTPAIKIANYPVKGMYMPDAIAAYTVGGKTYVVTANEGDAREYVGIPGGREDQRVRDYCSAGLDPNVFPDATNAIRDSNLGRLRVTIYPNGDRNGKNASGQCNELVAFGGRSFSIWSADDMRQVFDSGDDFEKRTAALDSAATPFNASNDNATMDNRSPAKGPEPEGVAIGRIGTKVFAFIGLERAGGVMAYDITDPKAPKFVTSLNTRNGTGGDNGPEGISFIRAAHSPTGKPLILVGNETSGTTAIYQLNLKD